MVEVTAQWSTLSGKSGSAASHLQSSATAEELPSPEQGPREDDEGWVLYNGTWFQKGKGGKGKGKGKGKSVRDPCEYLCPNCGVKGHTAQQCPKPEVPWEERPCHRCGEKGHISSRCPKSPNWRTLWSERLQFTK